MCLVAEYEIPTALTDFRSGNDGFSEYHVFSWFLASSRFSFGFVWNGGILSREPVFSSLETTPNIVERLGGFVFENLQAFWTGLALPKLISFLVKNKRFS